MFKARFSKRFALPMILGLLTMYSCSEKDYYDPNYGGGKKDNPLDVEVPADMDWNMLSTANITVDVNDEYNGEYSYIVEILDANPFAGEEYNVLDAGVAKKGKTYTANIEYLKGQEKTVYIRKTSPVKRVSITPYIIAAEDEIIVTRSNVSSRASAQVKRNKSTYVPEEYKELSYSTSGAIELTGDTNWNTSSKHLEAGKSYIIPKGSTFNGPINSNAEYTDNERFTIYVEGTWMPKDNSIKNANIIALNGGTINTKNHNSFLLADNSELIIQTGATFTGKDFNLTTYVSVKNFGTINVERMSDLNTSSVLYNAKKANITVSGDGTPDWNNVAVFTKGGISNFGTFTLKTNVFKINSQDETYHFYNGPQANVDVPIFIFGGIGTNDGTITCVNFNNGNGGNPTFTNNCNIYACDSFDFTSTSGTIILNKGVIAGGINDDGTFKPVPTVNCTNSPKIQLNNGSMIKATAMSLTDTRVTGGEGDVSLLKAMNIQTGWTTYFEGNMVVECTILNPIGLNANGIEIFKLGESSTIISSCNGSESPDENPNPPTEPTFPIEITTSTDYIYAMEDQWPYYGDYDMNDVVVGVSPQITNYIYSDRNAVKQIKFDIRLLSVGALKQIAAAIQLEKVTPEQVENVEYIGNIKDILGTSFYFGGNGVEANQEKAVVALFENANKLLGGNFVNVGRQDEVTPVEFTVVVNFKDNANIKPGDLGYKDLNFFIIPDLSKTEAKQRRPEIHLGGYNPTNLANPDLFEIKNTEDNGTKKYISNGNMVWGLIIPTKEWKCPDESVSIIDAYPRFKEWVTTGGKQSADWYKGK